MMLHPRAPPETGATTGEMSNEKRKGPKPARGHRSDPDRRRLSRSPATPRKPAAPDLGTVGAGTDERVLMSVRKRTVGRGCRVKGSAPGSRVLGADSTHLRGEAGSC